jgi:hypothetical protein
MSQLYAIGIDQMRVFRHRDTSLFGVVGTRLDRLSKNSSTAQQYQTISKIGEHNRKSDVRPFGIRGQVHRR